MLVLASVGVKLTVLLIKCQGWQLIICFQWTLPKLVKGSWRSASMTERCPTTCRCWGEGGASCPSHQTLQRLTPSTSRYCLLHGPHKIIYLSQCALTHHLPNSFFRRFFWTSPKTGSFRLLSRSRDAHRIFFMISSLIIIEIFAKRCHVGSLGGKGLILELLLIITRLRCNAIILIF